jgi:hypothetical protein
MPLTAEFSLESGRSRGVEFGSNYLVWNRDTLGKRVARDNRVARVKYDAHVADDTLANSNRELGR